MATYNPNGIWDLSIPPQLPSFEDNEFISLLQKQFGVQNDFTIPVGKPQPTKPSIGNINPQALTSFPVPGPTPPLSDDSPSPPSAHDTSRSRRQSGVFGANNSPNDPQSDEEGGLKRKASEEFDDEPNAKAQHTAGSSSAKKAGSSISRHTKDESRLVKRKEQNRAAQRAFRERKEKHVKDLEEKVAALEEKTSMISQENDTLRDVIAHLQSENMRLRESSFTFSMPSSSSQQLRKDPILPQDPSSSHSSPANQYGNAPRSSASSATTSSQPSPQSFYANDKDSNGLPLFNPSTFDTDSPFFAVNDGLNTSYINNVVPITETPFKTIASNPMYMSFREPYPYVPQLEPASGYSSNNSSASHPSGTFDFSQSQRQPHSQRHTSVSSWPDVPMPQELNQPYDMMNNSLDELFGGAYIGNQNPIDLSIFRSPSDSLSPVSHHNGRSPESSSGESSQNSQTNGALHQEGCPKTKSELANAIARSGGSVFTQNGVEHSPLPKTSKSDKNVEVMTAFDTIRSKYKDVDVNALCQEFADKAKCDGCKVVIEPSSMQQILSTVASRHHMQV